MQLTSTTDYAIRLVCFLAYKEQPCTAGVIAHSADIPTNYIPKIIKKLKLANLVGSVEGVQGGYYLLRKPEAITLWDILDTMESTMKINKCLEEVSYPYEEKSGLCDQREFCKVRAIFQQFQMDVERKLQEVTVAELIGKSETHPFGHTYVTLEIDAGTGVFQRVYAYDAFVRDYIPKEGEFQVFLEQYIQDYVHKEDRERIYALTSLDYVEEEMEKGYWEKQTRFRQRVRHTEDQYCWMELHQYFNTEDHAVVFVLQNSILAEQHMSTLEQELVQKSKSMEQNYWFAVELLGRILDEREVGDQEEKSEVIHYTEMVYRKLSELYPEQKITEEEIVYVSHLAPIRNIGKIRLPKELFLKREPLTEEEEECMRSHPLLGAEIVDRFPRDKNLAVIQQYSREICLYHHERYDGSGYPYGLQGEEIPLCAQVVGLVNVYEGLLHGRDGQPILEKERAIQKLLSGTCGSFSDSLLHSFLAAAMQPEWEIKLQEMW